MNNKKNDIYRPNIHFSVKKGWINDPNGLVYFRGKYHLFYQYNPYGCDWDSMHWGHAVSDDLLQWEERKIALFPDQSYDNHKEGGCFSGSVIIKDDRLYVFYTGSVKHMNRVIQSQCVAVSEDGFFFEKMDYNPIITNPPQGKGVDFRDPKVIYAQGRFRMLCGGTDNSADEKTSHGRIFLYNSDDLIHWEYAGILYQAKDDEGTMFECPDAFMIDNKWIITASPMYRSDYKQNIYMIGSLNFDLCIFNKETEGALDTGTHYYAIQTYAIPIAEKGNRNVSIAWIGGWNWMPWINKKAPTDKEGFRGILSVPRRYWIDKKGYLCSGIYPNYEKYIVKRYTKNKVSLSNTKNTILRTLKNFNETLYLHFTVDFDNWKNKQLQLFLWEEEKSAIEYILLFDQQKCVINYAQADKYSRYGCREFNMNIEKDCMNIEILVDKSVCTIFLADGRYANTTTFFSKNGTNSMEIKALDTGAEIKNVTIEFLK